MVENVGITNTNTKLLLNAVYAITGWIAAIIGARLQDVVGRRKMFLWYITPHYIPPYCLIVIDPIRSTAGMIVCLSITAGKEHSTLRFTASDLISSGTAAGYVETNSKSSSSASISFIYIFGVVFALGYTSMQPIYPGEVLTNDMRAKGMGVFQLTSGASGFVNTFAAPVALTNVSKSLQQSVLLGFA